MLDYRCLDAYREQYPEDTSFYGEPGGDLIIVSAGTKESYVHPKDETEEKFFDRLKRSRTSGRNLFYEEWARHVYEEDCLY